VFVDAYGLDVDAAGAIEGAQEQAQVRFAEHGWQEALDELAAERAWLAANRAAFSGEDRLM
jgi:hypothetical protein